MLRSQTGMLTVVVAAAATLAAPPAAVRCHCYMRRCLHRCHCSVRQAACRLPAAVCCCAAAPGRRCCSRQQAPPRGAGSRQMRAAVRRMMHAPLPPPAAAGWQASACAAESPLSPAATDLGVRALPYRGVARSSELLQLPQPGLSPAARPRSAAQPACLCRFAAAAARPDGAAMLLIGPRICEPDVPVADAAGAGPASKAVPFVPCLQRRRQGTCSTVARQSHQSWIVLILMSELKLLTIAHLRRPT